MATKNEQNELKPEIKIKESNKKEKSFLNEKFSKVLKNTGIKPVVIERNAFRHIVLHPNKTMRLEKIKADELLKQYSYLKEVEEE